MKLLIAIFFTLCFFAGNAQQNFLIYQIKGNVKVKVNAQKKALKIGQVLHSSDMVWLDKGAIVAIVCEGYNAFTIKKTGDHLLKNYVDSCIKETNSVTISYFKYIWKELTHPHQSLESNRREYMQNTGAVVRGCPGIIIDPIYDTINTLIGDLWLKWAVSNPVSKIDIVLYDSDKEGRLLFSKSIKENYIHLDSLIKYAGKNSEFYWNLLVDGNELCSRKYIKKLTSEEYANYLNTVKATVGELVSKAEYYFTVGFYLENDHFLAEALIFYQRALSLDPTNIRYKNAVNDFKPKR